MKIPEKKDPAETEAKKVFVLRRQREALVNAPSDRWSLMDCGWLSIRMASLYPFDLTQLRLITATNVNKD